MDGRIAHLRNHYRIHARHSSASDLASRLDRVCREQLAKSYEEALVNALSNDTAVYVIRRVHVRSTFIVSERLSDRSLARSWGFDLAEAVMRAIAQGSNNANLVRFENQADYVAQFLIARLKADSYTQWYFEGFAGFFELDSRAAINQVLLTNRDHLPTILANVYREGELDALINALDGVTMQTLWSTDLAPIYDTASARSLFSMAVQLSDRITRRTHGDGGDNEDLFRKYLATGPSPVDWQDPKSLAEAVFEVLRFLWARRLLTLTTGQDVSLESHLDHVLAQSDWLDREWLKTALANLVREADGEFTDLPVRSFSGRATPRQMETLSALARCVDQPVMSTSRADHETVSLRLLAQLAADSPDLIDAGAKVLIESLLTVGSVQQQLPTRNEFRQRLMSGDIQGALSLLPPHVRQDASQACAYVARLGEKAASILDRLCDSSAVVIPTSGVESEYAGLSLLLRSVLDFRLPLKNESLNPGMLFLRIALRLNGGRAITNGPIDAGLCLMSGITEETQLDDLTTAKPSDYASLQKTILTIAAARRLLKSEVMHVFSFESDDTLQVIAGDASGCIWPLGCVVKTNHEARAVVLEWLDAWDEATGTQPHMFIGSKSLEATFAHDHKEELLSRTDEVQAVHDAGAESLRQTFEALRESKLGGPDFDLPLAVVACMLLRMWSFWLRGFSSSSIPFLLENFVRRQGQVHVMNDGLLIELEKRPLDIVLKMAGYLDDLERVPWLRGGRVKFQVRGN
jgi:hypothetical protein